MRHAARVRLAERITRQNTRTSWRNCKVLSLPWPNERRRCRCVFDIPTKEAELAQLEAQTTQPTFWDDSRAAQAVAQRLTSLKEQVSQWKALSTSIGDLQELLALADGDDAMEAEISTQTVGLGKQLDQLEFELLFSGKYDAGNAILSISTGAGGVDAQDWAQMLLRMYLRWAQRRKFDAEIVDEQPGEEAGIKDATAIIRGRYAYAFLTAERGTHRLVRLSPFDSAKRRHTSFALVSVLPDVHEDPEVQIDPKDLRIDTFRATGAGGQHINKTDSAVRITHLPTGIVVTCQNERSQIQNREVAMNILTARLLERKIKEQEDERAKLRGAYVAPDFGSQIRNYVLHPYTMVKDLRTDVETSNVQAVLDGDLDEFMAAYLRWQVGFQGNT